MPPKTKFNKEDVLEAALQIAKEKGLSGITARSVANRLRSSVAPIYFNFATVDDLVKVVVQRVFAISEELMAKQKGESMFENIGKASLAFAREYPILFRELSLQPNPYMASYETIENAMIEAMAEKHTMNGWSLEERRRLFLKMRVFQMGLSAMVANDHVPSWLGKDEFEELLMEVGDELLLVQQLKHEEDLA